MNTEALILFLILLLGLVLCSFLGGNCGTEGFMTDRTKNRFNSNSSQNTNGSSTSSNINFDNYNHFQGSSTQLAGGTTYYGENGGSVIINTNSDGTQSLQVCLEGGQTPVTFTSQQPTTSTTEGYTTFSGANGNATVFYGPNGERATIINGNNGQQAVLVQTSSGTYIFTQSGTYYNPNEISNTQYYGSTGANIQQYNGAYGGSATTATGPYGNTAFYAEGPYGNAVAGTNANNDPYNNTTATQYYGPRGGSATSVTGPYGNTAFYAEGPYGNAVAGTNANNNQNYYDTLPQGIPASRIPPGQEDLYILKSQVVPPVCPACPVSTATCPREEPCPPCEPCGRCPEPAFECKKVPNYNAIDNNYLPIPVLSDFSSFGM